MNAIDWSKSLACDALGIVKRIEMPEGLDGQRFCYFADGKFKAYFEDGTPYNNKLQKLPEYRLRNVECGIVAS